ncbi:unnamed protein product [Effrenium voratum]|uniref:Uncharacterized protein n=1 Tax=Effrenium voratum TaxID=2562239 RepID=A0AA36JP47_9DINO|nr:unnamed protein product [Effrenium voratum]
MASALTIIGLDDELAAIPAPWRDRVQHHARRFQEKNATTVLNRYEQQRRIMRRPQLEKHAFHVASWLVLPEVRRSHGGSVEALLSRYLESLDGQPLCERLKAVLSLVSASSGVAGLSGLLGKGQKRKVEMMQAEEPEKPDSSKPVDACGEKAVRLMQKASQTWQNHPSECREAYVESLEQEVQEADGAENSAKLRMVLRRAVAALSPPRRLGDGCEGKLLASHASNDEWTLATNLQSRLRKIVLRCLDRVDMADLRVAPVLQCLQSLLQRFQELVTGQSRIACKKQWARLQAKCASTVPPEAAASLSARAKGADDGAGIAKPEQKAWEVRRPRGSPLVRRGHWAGLRRFDVESAARQLRQEKDATTVLNRYEQQRRIMSRPQLEKHAFHVASWLVLPEVRRSHGGSVEALLSRYLESLDGWALCERLKAVLSLVSASSGVAGLSGLLGRGQKRRAELMQAEEPEKPDSAKPVDACREKALRLMQKASQTWQNHPSECREVYVESLEKEMQEADGAENSAKLRMVLRRAVAALSPPRRLGDGCEGKLLASHASNDQSMLATNLQSRLRKIVLCCLDRVDLADLRLAPVVQCLQSLLQTFEELCTGESMIGCRHQRQNVDVEGLAGLSESLNTGMPRGLAEFVRGHGPVSGDLTSSQLLENCARDWAPVPSCVVVVSHVLRGMASALTTVCLEDELAAMPAPWRDRVQHHARRFHEKDATTVLNRYEQQRRIMSRPQLEKHAFHVASWLVLPEVRRSQGDSVEALLSRYLESLDGQPLCERLKVVLSLVSASSGVAGLSGLLGKGQKKKVEMMQAEEPEKPDSSKPVDACGEKAARLMQKASQTWQNHPSEFREVCVESLEQEMQEADGAENSAKLRMVLRRAVAALSPPRRLGDGCEGKLLASHASNDQATLATNLQSRLRKIVLCCLDRVDLADLRLAPVLQCLQSLLQRFQELVTGDLTPTFLFRNHSRYLQAYDSGIDACTMAKDATTVLNRYEQQRRIMSRPQLEKHAFHVASWLVLPEVRRSQGDSVEALLSRYLESLDGQPLCERLKVVLSLVSASSGVAGLSGLLGKGRKRKAEMMQAEEPEKPDSSKPVDACGEKAVQLMQKASQTWQNQPSEFREAYVDSLEQEMQEADGAENSAKLRMVLRRAVAALSPPRRLGDGCEGKLLASHASNDQATLATNLQSRLRKIVLRCLDRVDMADLRLAPVLQCLQSLLQRFQELVTGESRIACKKQWARLQAKCASTVPPAAAASLSACAKGAEDCAGIAKPESSASCPHGKASRRLRGLAEFVRGDLTSSQLLDNCARDWAPVPSCVVVVSHVLRGMASALTTIGLEDELAAMPAPWRDRVQHHARRFHEKDATTVLNRYEQQRRIMSRPQLERHAFHVACWLVLPEVRRSQGGSVEALLSRYLESLDGQPLCERLKAVLSLVSASSGVAGFSGLLGKGQKRKVEMMQAEEPEKPDSSKPVDACGEKALRLMQKASQTWQNHPCEFREVYVESLEQEMQEADGAENSAKLRMVLRRAVAALSPPRRLGDGCEGKMTASIPSNDEWTLATNLQSRLRKIVLRCLDRVDLADLRVAPVLQCLQSLLQRFQELVTGESRIACKKQWARLQAKCASTVPPEAAASLSASEGISVPCLIFAFCKLAQSGLGGAEAAGFASREAGPWAGLRKSGAEFMVQLLDNCDARDWAPVPSCVVVVSHVLRGMASALTTVCLEDELAAMPAPWRDRVQHHARRFHEKDATTVLNRYEQQRRIMSRPQLERHAFHVACWLVLPEVRRSHGGSVEALLSRYLESLHGQPLCERLKAVLSLVSASSGVAGLSGLLGKGRKRKVEMMQAEELEKPDSSKPVDACGEKALRLMQKASQTWQNHPSKCREAYVESLEQEMQEADGAENSAKLRMVLRQAVAALSPPRRLGDGCEGKLLASHASNDQATLATNLQSRLRKIVLRCLDRVDLADLRLAPVLQCLQSLLHAFQELVTSESTIACKKQWARLQAKCASTMPPEAGSSGVAGLSGLLGKGRKRKAEMIQAEEPEKPDSSKPVDACGEKAVRLMQKASQTWQNHLSECREEYVESLEQEMQEADGAENSAKLRTVLRRAVAALSPPRRLGDGCEGKTPSIACNDQSLATNLQTRLRKIVLRCLDRVDLADVRLAPVLQCLQSLLRTFQELVTGESRIACKKQWARLQDRRFDVESAARQLRQEKDATTVLNRYEQQRRIMSRPQLEKHAFHVASWLVLPEVRRSHGGSVEALLSRYLESLDGQPLCERLKVVLSLVSASSGVAGLSGLLGKGQKRKAEMMQAEELEKPASSKPVDACGEKAVRLLQPNMAEPLIRVPGRQDDASIPSNDEWTLATNLQSRLRKIVRRCLNRVDMADLRVAPVLQCLQSLLQRFQELVTGKTKLRSMQTLSTWQAASTMPAMQQKAWEVRRPRGSPLVRRGHWDGLRRFDVESAARQLRQEKDATTVLNRYEQQRRIMSRPQLEKHAFHVASWLVLPEVRRSHGGSVEALLSRYLESLDGQPLCERLKVVLSLVSASSGVAGLSGLLGKGQKRKAEMMQAEELEKPDSSKPIDACGDKAVRLMQKASQTWQNHPSECREAYVESLEQEMQEADGAENSAKLRTVLRRAVAALSPPRRLGDGCEGKTPSIACNDQSLATNLQTRLRKIVLRCLDRVDMSDLRVAPVLQCLQSLLQRFQELVTGLHRKASEGISVPCLTFAFCILARSGLGGAEAAGFASREAFTAAIASRDWAPVPSCVVVVSHVLCGMASALTTVCLEDELAAMPAPWRDRVQHHARRFQEKDATTVLNRYEQQRRIMSRPQLEKHAFHVASWLVLPEVRRSHGGSVEALLSRYLESLDGQPLCERLKVVLSLVSASSGVAGLSGLLGKGRKRKAEMMQAEEPEKPDSSKPVDACGEKAVQLMQKASQTWQNQPSECREAYVDSLEQEMQDADGAENSAKLRMVLRRAVAALSPPRRLGDGCEGKLLASHASNDQATLATNLQSRLRKIVLRCLDRVDMADLRLAPVLQCLQSLLQRFQELVTGKIKSNCAVQRMPTWKDQAELLAVQRMPTGKIKQNCLQCSACPHGKTKRNCLQCSACPHGKIKSNCLQCSACPHGKIKQNCLQCSACPHGKIKQNCLQCSACPHGKTKRNCLQCSACPHGKIKNNCVQCSACPHGKLKRNCLAEAAGPRGVREGPRASLRRFDVESAARQLRQVYDSGMIRGSLAPTLLLSFLGFDCSHFSEGLGSVSHVLRGMASALTTVCLEDELAAKPAPWRDRVQHHARRFHEKDATTVLNRYEQQRRIMSRPQLEKHAFHVASWLVLPEVRRSHGDSVEALLSRYLESLDGQPLCERLKVVLSLVSASSGVAGLSGLLGKGQKRKVEMMQAEDPEKPDSSKPVDACGEKAVRLMQKASQMWQNHPSECREAYVESLEQEVQVADGAENSAKLRIVLRRAVAALSPPRRLGDGCEGKLLASHASNDEWTLATNLQSRLRKIVLRCLDRVDMADLRVAPVLQCLQSLLQRFQELVTGQSRIACKKQWARLQAKCASTVPPEAAASLSARAKGADDGAGIAKPEQKAWEVRRPRGSPLVRRGHWAGLR